MVRPKWDVWVYYSLPDVDRDEARSLGLPMDAEFGFPEQFQMDFQTTTRAESNNEAEQLARAAFDRFAAERGLRQPRVDRVLVVKRGTRPVFAGPDDGDPAGVREPRRPSPAPSSDSEAAPLPPTEEGA